MLGSLGRLMILRGDWNYRYLLFLNFWGILINVTKHGVFFNIFVFAPVSVEIFPSLFCSLNFSINFSREHSFISNRI